MIELTGENFPDLFRMVKLICYRLKAPLLPVYIRQDQDYNAHTQGFLGNAWVVVNSSLIDDFTPGELAFIIGHEFAHIKRRHTTWLTLMSPASGNISSQLLGSLIRTIFNLWSLKCEHTADRGGLIAVRSMEDAAGALIKVAAGQKLSSQVDWRQALKEHDKRDGFLMKAAELLGTHPFPINRIKEIYMFSESRKYKAGGL
jgi:Zn-dependent protease with chaperone function